MSNVKREDMTEKFGDEDTDLSQWDRVQFDLGEKIDFRETPIFMGLYRGVTQTEGEDMQGNRGPVDAYLFTDTSGEERFCFASAMLAKALSDIPPGTQMRIEWLGKKDIKDGAQTVNRYKVWTKKASS